MFVAILGGLLGDRRVEVAPADGPEIQLKVDELFSDEGHRAAPPGRCRGVPQPPTHRQNGCPAGSR